MSFILLLDILIRKEALSEKLHEMRHRSESTIAIVTNDKNEERILSALRGNSSDSEEIPKRNDSQESLSSGSEISGDTYPEEDSVCITSY